MVVWLRIIFLASLFANVCAKPVDLRELHRYAEALNIEGGYIPKVLKKEQIWANLTVVLDRPIITGKTLDEITKDNRFPLKEASIMEYNEPKVNQAYAKILNYYLKHARRIIKSHENKPIKMIIQIHLLFPHLAHPLHSPFNFLKTIMK